ncbi:MAG: class I SAM-dependent methyltransferase [Defluviitaleaceae bacterium]|nr:class I SAM-dependent methyltransferase [Defluviitaleaceae bacterium]
MSDEIYVNFAQVYDRFMSETPYKKWLILIRKIWSENNLDPRKILDLACGTGAFTALLSQSGYGVAGLDASPDMLAAAREKLPGVFLTCQDMRRFELREKYDAAVCVCDSVNYLRNASDLAAMLSRVKNCLNPGGLFIFDIKTVYKYENMFANNTFAYETDDAAYIWANRYDKIRRVNTYKVDFFIRRGNGLYERFSEVHKQKAFEAEEIISEAESAGLEVVGRYDGNSFRNATEKSKRIFFALRRGE